MIAISRANSNASPKLPIISLGGLFLHECRVLISKEQSHSTEDFPSKTGFSLSVNVRLREQKQASQANHKDDT